MKAAALRDSSLKRRIMSLFTHPQFVPKHVLSSAEHKGRNFEECVIKQFLVPIDFHSKDQHLFAYTFFKISYFVFIRRKKTCLEPLKGELFFGVNYPFNASGFSISNLSVDFQTLFNINGSYSIIFSFIFGIKYSHL